MSNEQKSRILHHTVAVELTDEMVEEVSGGLECGNGSTIIYSTNGGSECRVDGVCDC